jgi:hypothetical protein
LRYHGVLAPASKWRKEIVPRVVETAGGGAAAECVHAQGQHRIAPRGAPAPSGAPPGPNDDAVGADGQARTRRLRPAVAAARQRDTHSRSARDHRVASPKARRRAAPGDGAATGPSSLNAPIKSTCSSVLAAVAPRVSSPRSRSRT